MSVAVASETGWILGAVSLEGNPYDWHALTPQLVQVKRLVGEKVKEAYVGMGYKGHGHQGPETVYVDKKRRGTTPKRLWKRMKRRAAVEPTIGHLKSEHRLEYNRLEGVP